MPADKRPVIAPLVLTAYLLWPAAGRGLLGGVPIGPIGALALVMLWVGWGFTRRPASSRIALGCLVVKIALSVPLLEHGFAAEYYANDAWRPPMERGLDALRRPFTRVDRAIDFGPAGSAAPREVPLFFVNDLRFNFYQAGEPDRERLPYSARWVGFWDVDREGPARLYVRTSGAATAALTIDGFPVVSLLPGGGRAVGEVALRAGPRRLRIDLSAPAGAGREVSAGFLDAADREHPFTDDSVFLVRATDHQRLADRAARALSYALDVLVLAWLAWWALAAATAVHALSLIGVLEAFHFAWPWATRVMVLPGGSDSLTYETYARDILAHGPLMTMGDPVGHAGAFYYQPLYPYVMAALHGLVGETFFGLVFFQRLLVPVTLAITWLTIRRLFGTAIGRVGLITSALFLYLRVASWAALAYGEIVFIPLVCAWGLLAAVAAVDASPRTSVAAGVAGGLATLSRSTLLLAWPVLVILISLAGPVRRMARAAAWMACALVAVTALATLRNAIAAHEFVPVTTSFGINFYMGNQPPPDLEPSLTDPPRLRAAVHDPFTRRVIMFAVQAPARFAVNLWKKALFTLGFFGALMPGRSTARDLIVVWVLALGGVLVVATLTIESGCRGVPRAIPGALALCHFVAGVIVFPFDVRLILPFYVLLLPYVAVCVSWTAQAVGILAVQP